MIRIAESKEGFLDLIDLENKLQKERQLLNNIGSQAQFIGCFSAASNVTGILADDIATTILLHQYGAYSFWDYSTAGKYIPNFIFLAQNLIEVGTTVNSSLATLIIESTKPKFHFYFCLIYSFTCLISISRYLVSISVSIYSVFCFHGFFFLFFLSPGGTKIPKI